MWFLKNRFFVFFIFTICISSCSTVVGADVFLGGVLGAGAGGIAGSCPGALIGGAAGMIVGGFVGTILDPHDRRVLEKTSPRTLERMDRGDPLTLNDIIKLSQSGVCDESIIKYLRQAKDGYALSRTQIHRLQEAGVSQRVIQHMLELHSS